MIIDVIVMLGYAIVTVFFFCTLINGIVCFSSGVEECSEICGEEGSFVMMFIGLVLIAASVAVIIFILG